MEVPKDLRIVSGSGSSGDVLEGLKGVSKWSQGISGGTMSFQGCFRGSQGCLRKFQGRFKESQGVPGGFRNACYKRFRGLMVVLGGL